ncbi:hypothetical protein J6590_016566, partial [Homalodisca vitripennis]
MRESSLCNSTNPAARLHSSYGCNLDRAPNRETVDPPGLGYLFYPFYPSITSSFPVSPSNPLSRSIYAVVAPCRTGPRPACPPAACCKPTPHT